MILGTRTSRWQRITALLVMAALLGGCSSAPRAFKPKLDEAPTDPADFQLVHESCKTQVAEGKRDQFHVRTAVGVGVGTGLVIGGAGVVGAGTLIMGTAVAGTLVAASIVIFALHPLGQRGRRQARHDAVPEPERL